MPPKKPNLGHGEATSGGDGGGGEDRLSTLPDALLHHVMSFLRAWEVARTCVLSRRWRHLWASAPCVDLVGWGGGGHHLPLVKLAKFAYRFFLEREVTAPVDMLRLLSSPVHVGEGEDYSSDDVHACIRAAIKRRARVIDICHPMDDAFTEFDHVPIISSHLKHLKLCGSLLLGDRTLEVLELRDCWLQGHEISSASLKSLIMVECSIMADLTIAAPNLQLLRCILPYHRAPMFENMGSPTLSAATLVLDDSFLHPDFQYELMEEILYGSSGDESEGCSNDSDYDSDAASDASTFEYSEIANDYDDEKQHGDHADGHNRGKHGKYPCYGHKNNEKKFSSYGGYSRKNKLDGDDVLGGHNVLHSLSNARSLELLADAGEVILCRALKTCPIFSNLKALSLGEWCMGADFNPLVSFLQHSPNLERLFLELELKKDYDRIQATKDNARPKGNLFACKHLKMVKIKCSMGDTRVHFLAQLLRANGILIENIYVRQICRWCLPTRPS